FGTGSHSKTKEGGMASLHSGPCVMTEQRLSMQRLLIVGDCGLAQRKLQRLFEPQGVVVQSVPDFATARIAIQEGRPDLVILDLDLPGEPGQQMCKQIKQARPWLPVIVASATKDSKERVRFLEIGAEDYVTKPVSPRELLARVRIVQ